eukprot:jgi/Ulvmu1/2601/UM014_0052.1
MSARCSWKRDCRSRKEISIRHARVLTRIVVEPCGVSGAVYTAARWHPPSRVAHQCYCEAQDHKSSDSSSAIRGNGGDLYPPAQTTTIRESWDVLMRWSRIRTRRIREKRIRMHKDLQKVAVIGGGSFATAMGAALARQNPSVDVHMLMRGEDRCQDFNELHENRRYLPGVLLPENMRASTGVDTVLADAQYVIHALPVQATRPFLVSIKDLLPPDIPVICVSKGIEQTTGFLLSELIPSALDRPQPCVFLSGPSFAKEVVEGKLTCVVAASTDIQLAKEAQQLFAQPSMRITLSRDVQGVEVCGALKNVLAIAAGIVEGKELGSNALAAVISQGCAEIRWLASKMGARAETITGLSGFADIMLTCYGALSRNRGVGIRLGQGESIGAILDSSTQVAEGVATAGSVVYLARKYRVSLPVLTAVASVLADDCTIEEAVQAVIDLPQLEER